MSVLCESPTSTSIRELRIEVPRRIRTFCMDLLSTRKRVGKGTSGRMIATASVDQGKRGVDLDNSIPVKQKLIVCLIKSKVPQQPNLCDSISP